MWTRRRDNQGGRVGSALVATASFLGCFMLAVPPAAASDRGWAAAEEVSLASYSTWLNGLRCHTGDDRKMIPKSLGGETADHQAARNYVVSSLAAAGWSVTTEYYDDVVVSLLHYKVWNIVGTKVGSLHPARQYIVGAHYDSWGGGMLQAAPGADDDASGIALILEVAHILGPATISSDCTIKLIAFDFEESPTGHAVGSGLYVADHSSDDVRGMISADMVAYDPDTNHALIFGRKESHEIKNSLAAAIVDYSDGLTCTIQNRDDASDHYAFEENGKQACMLQEGVFNPLWHTPDDTYENMSGHDLDYAVKMTRSVVGYLVDAAGVDFPTLTFTYSYGRPESSDPRGGTRVRVVVSGAGGAIPQPGTGWAHFRVGTMTMHGPMYEVESNVYEAVFPRETCGTHIEYWFTATAVGGEGYADPPAGQDAPYEATAGYGRNVFFQEDFEDCPEWTADPWWVCTRPLGDGGEHGYPDPAEAHSGYGAFVYNFQGDYPNNEPADSLTSFPINCTGKTDVHLGFWRWLGVEAPGFDHASISASTSGAPGIWQAIWENAGEIADAAWCEVEYDLSAVADNQPQVYVHWTMGPTDSDWRYCGWNIDDVTLTAIDCTLPLLGDMNCDGYINGLDIQPFVFALIDPSEYAIAFRDCFIMNGDINADHVVNISDVSGFIGCLLNGGCP